MPTTDQQQQQQQTPESKPSSTLNIHSKPFIFGNNNNNTITQSSQQQQHDINTTNHHNPDDESSPLSSSLTSSTQCENLPASPIMMKKKKRKRKKKLQNSSKHEGDDFSNTNNDTEQQRHSLSYLDILLQANQLQVTTPEKETEASDNRENTTATRSNTLAENNNKIGNDKSIAANPSNNAPSVSLSHSPSSVTTTTNNNQTKTQRTIVVSSSGSGKRGDNQKLTLFDESSKKKMGVIRLSDLIGTGVSSVLIKEQPKKRKSHHANAASSSLDDHHHYSSSQKKRKSATGVKGSSSTANTLTDNEKKDKENKKPNKLKKIILRERNQRVNDTDEVENDANEQSKENGEELRLLEKQENAEFGSDETLRVKEDENSMSDDSEKIESLNDQHYAAKALPAQLHKIQTVPSHVPVVREYVNQFLDPELDRVVTQMLTKLKEYQSRLYKNEPKKFKSNRRFVIGLRETQRAINSKKLIAVIMAPNIEKIVSPGGLNTIVEQIISSATNNKIPVIFSLSKRKIAKIFARPVNMSVIGIYSANGAHEEFKQMLRIANIAQEAFERQLEQQKKEEAEAEEEGEQASEEHVEGKEATYVQENHSEE